MLKYLITFQFLLFIASAQAQVIAPKTFDDELPIAPQVYDEYGGQEQVAFQKDPAKGKSFSILNKIKKTKKAKPKVAKVKTKFKSKSKRKNTRKIKRKIKRKNKKLGKRKSKTPVRKISSLKKKKYKRKSATKKKKKKRK